MARTNLAFKDDEFPDESWQSDLWFKTGAKAADLTGTESFSFEKEFVLVSPAGSTLSATEQPGQRGIPIYRILEVGAILIALLSCMSLGIWVFQDIPLIH